MKPGLVLLKKPVDARHADDTDPWLDLNVGIAEYEKFAALVAESGAEVSSCCCESLRGGD